MIFFKKKDDADKPCGRRRDRKATEFALLKAASHLFAEKGYENTRTLEIAKEAGANEALILRYFGGKEGLLMAIFKDDSFLEVMLQSKLNMCKEDQLNPLFGKKRDKEPFKNLIEDFFKVSNAQMDVREPIMRIASSRALVDREMASVIKDKMIDSQTHFLAQKLKEFFADQKKKITDEEAESLAMLISSANYSMNFIMSRVYGIDRSKTDPVLDLLSKSLECYFNSKKD